MVYRIIWAILAALFIAPLILAVMLSFAYSHDWYDPECCSGQDCYRVDPTDVVETETGWRHIPTGTNFSRKQVKPSKDRHFHVCIGNSNWNRGVPYCIYILQGT